MAAAKSARDLDEATRSTALKECLHNFPNMKRLRKEQKTCLINLACGKDVFAILPTGFRETLILFRHQSYSLVSHVRYVRVA